MSSDADFVPAGKRLEVPRDRENAMRAGRILLAHEWGDAGVVVGHIGNPYAHLDLAFYYEASRLIVGVAEVKTRKLSDLAIADKNGHYVSFEKFLRLMQHARAMGGENRAVEAYYILAYVNDDWTSGYVLSLRGWPYSDAHAEAGLKTYWEGRTGRGLLGDIEPMLRVDGGQFLRLPVAAAA